LQHSKIQDKIGFEYIFLKAKNKLRVMANLSMSLANFTLNLSKGLK